jgi:hypothetical protein
LLYHLLVFLPLFFLLLQLNDFVELIESRCSSQPLFIDDRNLDVMEPEVKSVFKLEAKMYGLTLLQRNVVDGLEDDADIVLDLRLPNNIITQIVNLNLFVLLSVYYVILSIETELFSLPDLQSITARVGLRDEKGRGLLERRRQFVS